MGRKRTAGVMLPKGVEKVTAKGRAYFYWNPGRGSARQGKRIKLPNPEIEPGAFWKELELYVNVAKPPPLHGSVRFLVQRYRDSEDFRRLSDSTKASYGVHLNRFETAWGALPYDLPHGAVLALRDSLAETAGMANHMLSVGRTLWNWGRSIGVQSNPFLSVANLDIGDVGHIPWPAWTVELVCQTAWSDLARMVRLGLATCQRESDSSGWVPNNAIGAAFGADRRRRKKSEKLSAFRLQLATRGHLIVGRRRRSLSPRHAGRRRSSAAIPIITYSRRAAYPTRRPACARAGIAGSEPAMEWSYAIAGGFG